MAESTLTLSHIDLGKEIGAVLSFGRTVANWSSDQKTVVDIVLARGLRQFYYPPPLPNEDHGHEWTFLQPVTTLTTVAPYSTGTISITTGTVTLASGIWPSWAASGELNVSGSTYTVATRGGDTTLTLDNTLVTVASGTSYSLTRSTYTLPDDFGGIEGSFTYASSTSGSSDIEIVGESMVRSLQQMPTNVSDKPRRAAIRPTLPSAQTSGQRFEVIFDPTPDAAYILTYRYNAIQNRLGNASFTDGAQYALGGAMHSETLLASCLYIAAQEVDNNELAVRRQGDFMARLAASVAYDRQTAIPDRLGYNGDYSDTKYRRSTDELQAVTYNGTLY
jgi:hypothetical protein